MDYDDFNISPEQMKSFFRAITVFKCIAIDFGIRPAIMAKSDKVMENSTGSRR